MPQIKNTDPKTVEHHWAIIRAFRQRLDPESARIWAIGFVAIFAVLLALLLGLYVLYQVVEVLHFGRTVM